MADKILLVDDEEDFLTILSVTVQSWGCETISARSGKEALEVLGKEKVKAVVIDYKMPDMDGLELLKNIRTSDKKLPAVVFTAYPDKKAMKEATQLNVTAFIPKSSPYTDTFENLKQTIAMICKRA